jgi:L-ascorbate metabolism protein UlaG (beta-lactamase superfamily)
MLIQWLGQSCFKIQTKSPDGEITLLIDPYNGAAVGLKQPRYSGDIVTVSNNEDNSLDYKSVKGTEGTPEPFTIKGPGEYEFKNVFVYGLNSAAPDHPNKNTLYLISAEDLTVAHLGFLNHADLTTEQLELIEDADILLVPVGGGNSLDAKGAAKIVSEIEPRVVIPMNYQIPGQKTNLIDAKEFIKEYGSKYEQLEKFRIAKKDLPPEETKLILLTA